MPSSCVITGASMSSPAISVLIPVYNVATRIQLCFNSLKAQTLQSAEFIFVDDGSTDGSGKLCDDFALR